MGTDSTRSTPARFSAVTWKASWTITSSSSRTSIASVFSISDTTPGWNSRAWRSTISIAEETSGSGAVSWTAYRRGIALSRISTRRSAPGARLESHGSERPQSDRQDRSHLPGAARGIAAPRPKSARQSRLARRGNLVRARWRFGRDRRQHDVAHAHGHDLGAHPRGAKGAHLLAQHRLQ